MRNNKNKSVFGRLAIIISIIVIVITAVLAVFFILEPGKKETIKIEATHHPVLFCIYQW